METAAGAPLVALREVVVRAPGGRAILDRLTLDVARGETLVLLGRSGSGKTTTLRSINRLAPDPAAGEVLVEGKRTTDWDPVRLRRSIGYVIQEAGLFPHWTAARNVGLVPALEGWEPARVAARVEELLRLVGLDPAEHGRRTPAQLSGGQRQRVGIARALAADPALLLMDEPFGALDPITRGTLARELVALRERLGKTVVFVTHDVREALRVGSRIALLQDGRLAFCGTPAALLASEAPEARAFTEDVRS